jgi:hypothetical protein
MGARQFLARYDFLGCAKHEPFVSRIPKKKKKCMNMTEMEMHAICLQPEISGIAAYHAHKITIGAQERL